MKAPLWHFLVAISSATLALGTVTSAAAQTPGPEAYRKYSLSHDGDIARGAKLFLEQRLLCANCHSLDGSASKAGPDLFAIGDKFGRRDLVDAILYPSQTISPGYGTVIVETTAGGTVLGTLKQKSEAGLQIMGADGKMTIIPAAEIKAQTGGLVSLMPEGLQASLSTQEFTDLVEYLTSLKQADSAFLATRGMPGDLPLLEKPITAQPFFTHDFKVPRTKAESGLTSVRQVPGLPSTFLVLHQEGLIWRVEKTAAGDQESLFTSIPTEVFSERGPNGMLDVAFHPGFRQNRKYYLFYQVLEEGKVTSIILEKQFSDDFTKDSGQPGRRIITIPSVAEDHSGGCLQFGPDGFLYLVMGDTGPHNDPNGHAQNLELLLGKVLRLDVDHQEDGKAYAIPADNPFRQQAGARPEIWAYGFRNPWRFSFDRQTNQLWLADVGQDRVEEVDLVRRGANYGWNVLEGFEPFSNQYRREGRAFTAPVFAYRRKFGNSITGGFVYRGSQNASFKGVYICGDYNSKRIFGITEENGALKEARQIGTIPQRLSSFCEDEAGNLYAVGYEGAVYKLELSGAEFK